MTFEEIYAVDSSNMYRLLKEFPQQVEEAVAIGKSVSLKLKRGISQIVLTGLGNLRSVRLLRDIWKWLRAVCCEQRYTLPGTRPGTQVVSLSGNRKGRTAHGDQTSCEDMAAREALPKKSRSKRQSLIMIRVILRVRRGTRSSSPDGSRSWGS
jgi:hypothetical protein